MKSALFACSLAFLICISGCAGEEHKKLTVLEDQSITYICEERQEIDAVYYSLSDNSLHFVKITLPDGTKYTLPQALSASGVRYTDGFDLVWWTKGMTAFAETCDEKGEWQIKYKECSAIQTH